MLLEGLIEALAVRIEKWLTVKGHTYQVLSDKSKVSYATVRRVAQRQFNSIASHRAWNILSVVTDRDDAIAVMNKNFDGLGDYLASLVPAESGLINEISMKHTAYRIFSICDTSKGMARTEIEKRYGTDGIQTLDRLIAKEFLFESEGIIKSSGKKWIVDDTEATARMGSFALGCLADEDFDDRRAFIALQTDALNAEAAIKVRSIKADAEKRIAEIIADKSNAGEIIVFSLSAMGTIK